MFWDLSREKMLLLGVVLMSLTISVVAFLSAEAAWNVVDLSTYSVGRSWAGVRYALLHKLPAGNLSVEPGTGAYAKSIPILVYHGDSEGEDEGGQAANLFTPSVFVEHLRALKEDGWQTVTLRDFMQWERGEILLPDKSFLLMFDDGRKDTFYDADPVMEDMGFTGVMFVITAFSLPDSGRDSQYYLNRTELRAMLASGRWELHSHGKNDHAIYRVQSTTDLSKDAETVDGHFLSNKFWNDDAGRFETDDEFRSRVHEDLLASRQALESEFGITVDAFAYPFNNYGQIAWNFPDARRILAEVVPTVYSYAFYQVTPGRSDLFNYPRAAGDSSGQPSFMIKRFGPPDSWSGGDLLAVLDEGRVKTLPFSADAFGSEWVKTWGGVERDDQGLVLFAQQGTTGAAGLLSGTGWWSDYLFTATLDWQAGDSIVLLAREQTRDFVSCAFSDSSVVISRRHNDVQTTAARAERPFQGPRDDVNVSIGVMGDTVTCYENDIPVVASRVPGISLHGGVGVEVWDPQPDVARAILRQVQVRTLGDADASHAAVARVFSLRPS